MSHNVHFLPPPRACDPAQVSVELVRARIMTIQADGYQLDLPGVPRVRRALSCLVEPIENDWVLVALGADAHQPAHILGVLERPDSQDMVIPLPGGSKLHAQDDGSLQLRTKSLQLEAQGGLSLQAGSELQITAVTANSTVKHWQGWFETLNASAVRIEYSAKSLSSHVGRLVSRVLESFRSVEGLDEIRAGRSRTVVQGPHHLKAGHITAQAQGFVRIDGQKIDLG